MPPSFKVGLTGPEIRWGRFPRLIPFVVVARTKQDEVSQSEWRPYPCPDQSPSVVEVGGAVGVADLIDEVLKTPGQAQGLAQGQAEP